MVIPAVVTTLDALRGHGADAAVWRRLGRSGCQTLPEALDNLDGDALYHRRSHTQARAEGERWRAAERAA